MAVALDDVPAERTPFRGRRFDRIHPRVAGITRIRRPTELLKMIPIEDAGQIVESITRCGERSFPDLAFLDLAVSKHHPRAEVLGKITGSDRHTDSRR